MIIYQPYSTWAFGDTLSHVGARGIKTIPPYQNLSKQSELGENACFSKKQYIEKGYLPYGRKHLTDHPPTSICLRKY